MAGGYLVFFYRFGEFYTRFAGGRGFFLLLVCLLLHTLRGGGKKCGVARWRMGREVGREGGRETGLHKILFVLYPIFSNSNCLT